MAQGHHPIKKHTHKKTHKFMQVMDDSMYLIALIAPIMTIPQLLSVIQRNVKGVSLLTWGSYSVVSALWLLYGFLHKDKPLILSQILLLILDSSIVLFVLVYR